MKKRLMMVFVLAIASLLLVSCGSKSVSVNMEMTEFKFIPDTINVPAGSEVNLNLSNTGTLEHDMVIMVLGSEATAPFDANDEANIFWQQKVEPGDQATFTFTAPSDPGEYQIVCGIPAHLEQGMVAKMIVK